MMRPNLQQRFDQLLGFAKNPKSNLTARENIAAAKEMVDTLLSSGLLTTVEYKEYRSLVMTAQLVVSAAELEKAIASTQLAFNSFDGSRICADFVRRTE